MSATVKTCVVWVGLPVGWGRRCKNPETMRRRFGPFTPQPFALMSPPGPMYLFCVAMDAQRATEIIEAAGACVCCQATEGIVFDVSQYTPAHAIRPANRTAPSGEEEYELIPTQAPKSRQGWPRWRTAHHGPVAPRSI